MKENYNIIEIEDENKSFEEIQKIVNKQWLSFILKYLEKNGQNA